MGKDSAELRSERYFMTITETTTTRNGTEGFNFYV